MNRAVFSGISCVLFFFMGRNIRPEKISKFKFVLNLRFFFSFDHASYTLSFSKLLFNILKNKYLFSFSYLLVHFVFFRNGCSSEILRHFEKGFVALYSIRIFRSNILKFYLQTAGIFFVTRYFLKKFSRTIRRSSFVSKDNKIIVILVESRVFEAFNNSSQVQLIKWINYQSLSLSLSDN